MFYKSILKKIFAQKNSQAERPQAGMRFAPGWPMLGSLCLILICAVAWSFYMGYMVGRGENPQAGIHEMTGFMKPEQTEPENIPSDSFQAEQVELAPIPDALRRPQGSEAQDAWQEKPKPVQKPARPTPPPRQQKPDQQAPDAQIQYAYTFQLAALREQPEAQKLQKALQERGIKASVQKSGQVFLVTAGLRGGRNEVEKFREKLKGLRIGEPLQISRKPLDNKRR